MSWFTFTVTPIVYGDLVASRLRVEERVPWEVMASRERPGESLPDQTAGAVPALGA